MRGSAGAFAGGGVKLIHFGGVKLIRPFVPWFGSSLTVFGLSDLVGRFGRRGWGWGCDR
jgi:hypothetical protein